MCHLKADSSTSKAALWRSIGSLYIVWRRSGAPSPGSQWKAGQRGRAEAKSTTVQQNRTILHRNIDFLYEIKYFLSENYQQLYDFEGRSAEVREGSLI